MASGSLKRGFQRLLFHYGLRYESEAGKFLGLLRGVGVDISHTEETVTFVFGSPAVDLSEEITGGFGGFRHCVNAGLEAEWFSPFPEADAECIESASPCRCVLRVDDGRLRQITVQTFVEIPELVVSDFHEHGAEDSLPCVTCGVETATQLTVKDGAYLAVCGKCRGGPASAELRRKQEAARDAQPVAQHGIRWKRVLRDALILLVLLVFSPFVVPFLEAFVRAMAGVQFIAAEPGTPGLAKRYSALIVLVVGFTASGYYAKIDRLRHLVLVGLAAWMAQGVADLAVCCFMPAREILTTFALPDDVVSEASAPLVIFVAWAFRFSVFAVCLVAGWGMSHLLVKPPKGLKQAERAGGSRIRWWLAVAGATVGMILAMGVLTMAVDFVQSSPAHAPPGAPGRSPAAVPVRNPAVTTRRNDDGTVTLLVPPDGRTISLDEIGSYVWESCDGETTIEELADALAAKYQLQRKEAQMSTVDYLKTLVKDDLLGIAVPAEQIEEMRKEILGKE